MEQGDFLTFKSLMKTEFINRIENAEGNPVLWKKVRWINYQYNSVNTRKILFKTLFSEEEPFEILDIGRKKSMRPFENKPLLSPICNKPLNLSKDKLQYLNSLLQYITSQSKLYYKTFVGTVDLTLKIFGRTMMRKTIMETKKSIVN